MLELHSPVEGASDDIDSSDTDSDDFMPPLPTSRPVPPRRTQSLFGDFSMRCESHCDSPRDDDDAALALCANVPTFTLQNESIPRISAATLLRALNGDYAADIDEVVVIDCRFAYEYEGGHVEGAVHIEGREALELHLARWHQNPARRLFVMHCEFSILRGPAMARYLRQYDRHINADTYPRLSFPNVVVLDGGYCAFHALCKQKCLPQGYVEMNDPGFEERRRLQMRRVRADERVRSCTSLGSDRSLRRHRHRHSSAPRLETSSRPLLHIDVRSPSCLLLLAGVRARHESVLAPPADFIPPCPSFMLRHPLSSPDKQSSSPSSACSDYSPTSSISLLLPTDFCPFFDDKLPCEPSFGGPPLLFPKRSPVTSLLANDGDGARPLAGPFVPRDPLLSRKRSPFN